MRCAVVKEEMVRSVTRPVAVDDCVCWNFPLSGVQQLAVLEGNATVQLKGGQGSACECIANTKEPKRYIVCSVA